MRPLPALTLLLAMPVLAIAADKPNVLIIMADDCTHSDLPVYGGRNAKTPNIDRLAAQGLVFHKAYLASAMCQPCRAELFTGQYPLRNGCAWNHSASRPNVRSLPNYLREAGYRTGIAGKIHVKPRQAFPFEEVGGFDRSCVRSPTRQHELQPVADFISRDDQQPFCLVVALVEPHVPWVMGDASKYPPEKIMLPPNIADTTTTREAFSRYLAEITYMDGQVGSLLQTLDESGKVDDTLVLFTSEQGSQFPGCKWTSWDTGLHTAMIARWPGEVAANKRTDALVQYCDVVPTLIEAAGGSVPGDVDGSSFLPVLRGQKNSHRRFTYGVHNNLPEGPAYPIRTVFDGTHRYIRNLRSDEIYIEKHLMGWTGEGKLNNPYWATWVRESWNNERTYNLVRRYQSRPAEELYKTTTDPYELNNRAGESAVADIKARLSAELDRWMKQQGDPGAAEDTQRALQAARKGKHLFGPHRPRQP